MRGNPKHRYAGRKIRGSIPAHAGEPLAHELRKCLLWVYPRACGGTPEPFHGDGDHEGLSPRMRGNLERCVVRPGLIGSIPAHAGEPFAELLLLLRERVYPRACGGTLDAPAAKDPEPGLSPRMRGNPRRARRRGRYRGSIPAHAGEPFRTGGTLEGIRVYPRACGGTRSLCARKLAEKGLSPRMRGNHRRAASL